MALLVAWCVITLLWSWWVARRVSGPLGNLLAAIRVLRTDPLATPTVPVDSADELGSMAATFNQTVEQLREREHQIASASNHLTTVNLELKREVLERRQTEAQLKRTSEFLQMAQSAGGIALFDMDLRTGLIQGSDLFFELLQIAGRDRMITQEQWMASVHPDDLDTLLYDLGEAQRSAGQYHTEYRSLRGDGSTIWVSSNGRVMLDDEGRPTRVVGTMADISARQIAGQGCAAPQNPCRLRRTPAASPLTT
ncbi:MAG: PAS domain-containing protein [Gammaproteobacteria bacterium]|nr:PAS domain-containing protein [Gammaproteobacteria bacterium]